MIDVHTAMMLYYQEKQYKIDVLKSKIIEIKQICIHNDGRKMTKTQLYDITMKRVI